MSITSDAAVALSLDGLWIVDSDRSTDFNNKKVSMSQAEKTFLLCGRQEMAFEESKLTVFQDEVTCKLEEQEAKLRPFIFDYKFQIIGQTEETVVIEVVDAVGVRTLEILYFEEEDLFWVYHFYEGDDTHLRIYYRRVTK